MNSGNFACFNNWRSWFYGQSPSRCILSRGHEIIGIDNLIGGYKSNVPEGVKFYEYDLLDLGAILPCFSEVDLVLHAACTAYE